MKSLIAVSILLTLGSVAHASMYRADIQCAGRTGPLSFSASVSFNNDTSADGTSDDEVSGTGQLKPSTLSPGTLSVSGDVVMPVVYDQPAYWFIHWGLGEGQVSIKLTQPERDQPYTEGLILTNDSPDPVDVACQIKVVDVDPQPACGLGCSGGEDRICHCVNHNTH